MASISADKGNQLGLSWQDPAWVPHLTKDNVLDYFSERSNPFYDRTCNNETIKMQRLGLEHLENMVGLEYILLHHQAPILYVIRKQRRHSPRQGEIDMGLGQQSIVWANVSSQSFVADGFSFTIRSDLER